jgi:succinoglycan biosynthesis protein ExoM
MARSTTDAELEFAAKSTDSGIAIRLLRTGNHRTGCLANPVQADLNISVCVVTYRRPGRLARLLESLAQQAGSLPTFEIVVVDNDADSSAQPVCRQYEGLLPIRYEAELVRGISQARNRSVQASRGRYLAFVDDDCLVGPDWLAALYAATVESGADGVIGPISRQVEGELPGWVRQLKFFERPRWVTGTVIPWYWTHTCNACVRRSALPSAAPFDPALGLIGGEDVDLFARMIERGARVVAIESPGMEERRPAARANAAWLIRRSFRNGGTRAHIEWRNADRSQLARHLLDALWRAASHFARAPFRCAGSRSAAFACILRAVTDLGMAAWVVGLVYAEYRRPS